MTAALRLFIIYAREDEAFRAELKAQLVPMERAGHIRVWTDRELLAGDHWEPAIKAQLRQADIILLLVSTDYFQSDYIHEVEIKEALERHQQGEAKVIPVIVRPCDWESDGVISSLQILPSDGVPVNDTRHWHTRDAAWVDVVRGLRKTIQQLREDRAEAERKKQILAAQEQAALAAAEQKQREAREKAAAEAERQRLKAEQRLQAEVARAEAQQRKAEAGNSGPLLAQFKRSQIIMVAWGLGVFVLFLVYMAFFRGKNSNSAQEVAGRQETPAVISPKPALPDTQTPQDNQAEVQKHLNDAAFLISKGKTEAAKEHLKNALQLDPQNPKAKDALFLLDKGITKEAARVLQNLN